MAITGYTHDITIWYSVVGIVTYHYLHM